MSDDPRYPHPKKPLVTVEFQREVDVATGRVESRMFVKMYFEAIDSGLLAALGPRRWHTLCALARYMNADGYCYPSQARMAVDLGIHRQRVNERIKEIREFRFLDKPVVTATQVQQLRGEKGRWARNIYQIHPISGLGIFATAPEKSVSGNSDSVQSPSSVSENPDTEFSTVSELTDTVKPDMNKNQLFNKTTLDVGLVKKLSRTPHQRPSSKRLATTPTTSAEATLQSSSPQEIEAQVLTIRSRLQDTGPSDRNIRRIVERMPRNEVEFAVLEAWASYRDGRTQKPTAYFVGIMQNRSSDLGIDLGLGSGKK